MLENNNDFTKSPLLAMSFIPTPNENAKEIVALVKQGGEVTGYKLCDGTLISKNEGVMMAKEGNIKGVGIATNQGSEYLKSLPDNSETNNLSLLSSITD